MAVNTRKILYGIEAVFNFISEHLGQEFEVHFNVGDEDSYFLTDDTPKQAFVEFVEGQNFLTVHFERATSGFSEEQYKFYLSPTFIDKEFVGYTVVIQSVKDEETSFRLTLKSMHQSV